MNDVRDTPAPPSGAWRWPLVVVGLLVMCVVTQVVLIVVAVSDPRQHVEADYYQKGLDWDAHVAEAKASRALGWTVRVTQEPVAGGARILTLRVVDGNGAPLEGAEVRCEARHRAALNHPLEAELAETAPGTYAGAFAMRREGVWELALSVVLGEQRYVASEVLDTRHEGL